MRRHLLYTVLALAAVTSCSSPSATAANTGGTVSLAPTGAPPISRSPSPEPALLRSRPSPARLARALPASHALLCKDLKARRYTFAEANRYWVREGRPGRMDADLNGIPCQTVYALAQVQTIYPQAEAPVAQMPSTTVTGTGPTAQCRDGSLSYSQHRSGTCSHHHGVAVWY